MKTTIIHKRTRHLRTMSHPVEPSRLYLLPLIPPSILWQRRDPKGLKRNSRDTSLTLTFSNSSAFYEKGSHGCIFVTRHLGPSRLRLISIHGNQGPRCWPGAEFPSTALVASVSNVFTDATFIFLKILQSELGVCRYYLVKFLQTGCPQE